MISNASKLQCIIGIIRLCLVNISELTYPIFDTQAIDTQWCIQKHRSTWKAIFCQRISYVHFVLYTIRGREVTQVQILANTAFTNASRCFYKTPDMWVWQCLIFMLWILVLNKVNLFYCTLIHTSSKSGFHLSAFDSLTRHNAIEIGSAPLTYIQSKYVKQVKIYSSYETPKSCL